MKTHASTADDRWNPGRPAPAAGEEVRSLLRTVLDEPRLSAAVEAVEAVVAEYLHRAETALRAAGRSGLDGPWPTVRLALRRGVPPPVLERSLWQAHVRLLDCLLGRTVLGDTPAANPQWGDLASRRLASFTAGCCEEVGQAYAAPEGAVAAADDGPQWHRLLLRLFADGDIDTAEIERVLGAKSSDHHWAVVLWTVPGSGPESEDLVRFARTVARSVGASRPLVPVNDTHEVLMCAQWSRPPRQEAIAEARTRLTVPDGVMVGAGPIAPGAAGLRRSLLGARSVRRAAGQLTGSRWFDYTEVSSVALLTRDEEQARWFVEDVLGDLGRDDPWCATLRETLRLYLAHGRSRQQVAAMMYNHRNTVAYRVQKASELLGRELDEDAFDVRLALEIARSHRPVT